MGTILAFLSKMGRDFRAPFQRLFSYVRMKRRWHGIVRFDQTVELTHDSHFEGANSIGSHSYFCGKMGYGSYLGRNSWAVVEIGRFCSIGHEFRIANGTHPIGAPFATTSPLFYSTKKQAMYTFAAKNRFEEVLPQVVIGNDCWIGDRVEIVGGKHIGDGAVILTGAVVTKDVPPYAIVGGVPAKVLRYRYDEETIAWLLNVRWWDKPIEWLKEHSELLCDMDKLKAALDEN